VQLLVESKRRKLETLRVQYPDALILDVTSKGALPWVRFSPFFPHGNIPVPFSSSSFASSVEGVWQGLKVFEHEDVDLSKFSITTMKGIKRSGLSRGKVLGHRAGERLLTYGEARYLIYLPAYKWVLDHYLQPEVNLLKEQVKSKRIILLDYETNADVENLAAPLSHAALVIRYLEDNWPTKPEH
jgi:hypothetical protein